MKDKKLTIPEYKRIFNIINSVITSHDEISQNKSCLLYSIFGAFILKEFYKMDAKVVTGHCGYHLGLDKNIFFGTIDDGYYKSRNDAFHAVVLVDDIMIDFMSPNFVNLSDEIKFKPFMFQRNVNTMLGGINELKKKGDFYFEINDELTNALVENLIKNNFCIDLAEIIKCWFKKAPKKIQKEIKTEDGYNIKTIKFIEKKIEDIF